jgi:hypothetical protein
LANGAGCGRVWSTRGAFIVCVLGFTASSAACAGAAGFRRLVAARVVQGFFGGFLIPLVCRARLPGEFESGCDLLHDLHQRSKTG